MLAISLPPAPILPYARLVFLTVSYVCLIEFARAAVVRPPGRWIVILPVVTVVLVGLGGGMRGALLSVQAVVGLPASMWTGYVIARSSFSITRQDGRFPLMLLAVAIVWHGVLSTFLALHTWFALPSSSNSQPDALVPFAKLLHATVILVIVLGVLVFCRIQHRPGIPAPVAAARCAYDWLMIAGFVMVLATGGLVAHFVGHHTSAKMRGEILNRTKIAGASIDSELVQQLTWSDADLGQTYYEKLKSQMMAIRQANEDLVFASLMGIRDGKSYVLVDSEPPESEDYSPPGQYYEEADPEYNRLLEARKPFVIGPLFDRWGVWMTGAVPITDVGPPPGAVALALDLNASHWNAAIFRARLPVLFITLLIGGMLLSFSVAQREAREIASFRAIAAERFERQKHAIVKLATSPRRTGTDFKVMAEEITEIGSEALQVERVSIWLGGQSEGKLTCVDLFERSARRHSSGQVLEVQPYRRYFEALGTGRAIDAHDAQNDPRTSEFRDVYLAPLHITSMLDAPIRVGGQPVGIICYEHTGPLRVWTEDEIRFAAETADQAAQALADIDRRKTEEAKRKLEQQIQYSQKLESLGVLAGGIAHDFNNMLMVILGNVELAMAELPPNTPVREHLIEMEGISRRAADLCRQLLAYAGKGHFDIQPIDLNRMIMDMQNMLQLSVSKKALLRYDLAEDLPAVEADSSQIQQVLMNLVINASESLRDREGIVTISTRHRYCESHELTAPWRAEPLPAGQYILLEVRDTGCGIPPEVRDRIFEPFVTTKFSGRGLGLAAVMGIVQRHKGTIQVSSEPERGSIFRVYLPASTRAASAHPKPRESTPENVSGTILVVDDEQAVCRVAEKMLASRGLTVLTASDGRQAIEILRAHTREIDGVILDLTMPHMDGAEAFREIRKLRPDIPIILSSGYTEEIIAERFAGADVAAFIEKPYSYARLVDVLKQVFRKS